MFFFLLSAFKPRLFPNVALTFEWRLLCLVCYWKCNSNWWDASQLSSVLFFYLWPRLVQIISFNAFSRYLTFLKSAWCLFELAAGVHYGIIWITHLVEQVWFKPQGQNIEINVNLNSNDIVCVPSDSLIRFAFIEICLCHTIVEYTCSLLQQSNNKSNLHGITLSF